MTLEVDSNLFFHTLATCSSAVKIWCIDCHRATLIGVVLGYVNLLRTPKIVPLQTSVCLPRFCAAVTPIKCRRRHTAITLTPSPRSRGARRYVAGGKLRDRHNHARARFVEHGPRTSSALMYSEILDNILTMSKHMSSAEASCGEE